MFRCCYSNNPVQLMIRVQRYWKRWQNFVTCSFAGHTGCSSISSSVVLSRNAKNYIENKEWSILWASLSENQYGFSEWSSLQHCLSHQLGHLQIKLWISYRNLKEYKWHSWRLHLTCYHIHLHASKLWCTMHLTKHNAHGIWCIKQKAILRNT